MFVLIAAAAAAPLSVSVPDGTLDGDALTIRPVDGAARATFGALHIEGNSGGTVVIGDATFTSADGAVATSGALAAAGIAADGFTTTDTGCIVDGAGAVVGVDGGGIIKGSLGEGSERIGGGIIKGSLAEGAERVGGGIVTGTVVEGSERREGGGGGILTGSIGEGSERREGGGGGIVTGTVGEGSERTGGGVVTGGILEGSERYCADDGPSCVAVALIDGADDFAPAVVIEDGVLSAWFDGADTCALDVWSEGAHVGGAEGPCAALAAVTAATGPWEVYASTEGGVPRLTLGWTGGTTDPSAAP